MKIPKILDAYIVSRSQFPPYFPPSVCSYDCEFWIKSARQHISIFHPSFGLQPSNFVFCNAQYLRHCLRTGQTAIQTLICDMIFVTCAMLSEI